MMFDVAVIGAGPSGAIAAKICANNKMKTILIEKKPLPRDKPCGGWLTSSALRVIQKNFGEIPQDLLEKRIEEIILLPDCEIYQPISAVSVYRKFFDYWLTQSAEKEGAVIRNATLKSLFQKQDYIAMSLKCNNLKQEISAKYVVGADGAGSTVRSRLYPNLKRQLADAYQVYVEGQLPKNAVYVYFPLKEPQVTYFWMIPKKKIVGIGVGGLPPIDLKKLMKSFLSMIKEKFKLRKILKYETFPIPVFSPTNLALGQRRILLVGDAASLVNPFTGEGIFSSLVSGKLASQAITKNFDEPSRVSRMYKKKLKPLLTELREMYALFIHYQSLDYTRRQSFLKGCFEANKNNWRDTLRLLKSDLDNLLVKHKTS